ncbi:NAD(P)H-binding protein [Streptomyces luomodiensis]|uniref:NAD(P)H-binding protein n=1 Tax=Streptomyces luomodiensis TaxID=3026192 RepID=A0ABY9V789_9ACTN|nr:NAD(P)H-binding protein [Streptomyces sp. SCA4-21]WNE99513.1 NAD(P)H-binding protein [Streptomyces sp. SCA4-21]
MRVLLTGGTGYIGAAVLDRLISGGHQVTAVVRSAEKAELVRAKGVEPAVADLADGDTLEELAAASEGVIHVASPGDETSATVDEVAVTSFLRALRDTDRPFVHTTGVWLHGSGSAITESSGMNPPRLTAWRVPLGTLVRDAQNVRTSVIAPAVVYGHGGGLLNLVAAGPRTAGNTPALTMIGPGDQHSEACWSRRRASPSRPSRSSVCTTGSGSTRPARPTERLTASVISRTVGFAPPAPMKYEPAGAFSSASTYSSARSSTCTVLGDRARRVLGWSPTGPSVLDDIARTDF